MKRVYLLLVVALLLVPALPLFAGDCGSACSSCSDQGSCAADDEVVADTDDEVVAAPDEQSAVPVVGSEPPKAAAAAPSTEPVAEPVVEAAQIDAQSLQALIQAQAPVAIVDARGAGSDDVARIPGAVSLTSEASAEEIAKALPDKEQVIVTYCANAKCPASLRMYNKLQELGYTNIMEFTDGIAGWKEAGFETTAKE